MNRINNKGFTLVELLAVIVIMGILMMIAIPSVTRIIENSRKDTFVDIAKAYGNAARTLWNSDNLMCGYGDTYASSINDGDYYILIDTEDSSSILLDQGGKSSWGNRDVKGYVRVNVSTTLGEDKNADGVYEVEPRRVTKFYVALSDGTHGIYDDLGSSKELDKLARGDMLMNLNSSEQREKLESITTDPFIVEEVTTCNTEGGNRTVKGVSFENDSWLRISGAVKAGTHSYQVGDTREIDMGSFGTHTIRVANTTPCTTETSHTACGFVLEFTDIIGNAQKMNSLGTNVGGWPVSTLRPYINNDIFNSLPSDLRRIIIDTTVISGYGSTPGETNFISKDKLYLLSTMEIFGEPHVHDTVRNETRQLDYYKEKGTNPSNYTETIKKRNGTAAWWWLRSARNYTAYHFSFVRDNGMWDDRGADHLLGVSPAFKIG